jgi:putative PIN family toxin of toxin-antitoxin system
VRVIYDCMVFVQGALRETGPAYRCLRLAEERVVTLLVSRATLDELREVLFRPSLREKSKNLTDDSVARFLREVHSFSEAVPGPPKAFALPRDSKDEVYTDLAIDGRAQYLVSWNERHLNYLMKRDTPEGEDFCGRYPSLKIVTPVEFLEALRASSQAGQ